MKTIKSIMIIGCSRFGAHIASTLSLQNKHVVIIDSDHDSFDKLSESYSGYTIYGDGTDLNVLIEAGIKNADMVVAATNNDNVNVMISQISSKIFHIKNVVSRLYDFEKEIVYHDLNVDIIKPAKLTLDAFENIWR